ncbi:hypothetical protein PN498_01180 [Oscillatoria sp. CS-180]|uniref:hypothetical protein n=1 Tax=Oscillatoria sp. CS-180 TaxID=3021720 RepID=UPI00232D8E21|nr:hypothetical protein [Oscillatoria sp. CS-180]MDB9524586.1 hypothetical protein [Oscillatoria sp. CS-180]
MVSPSLLSYRCHPKNCVVMVCIQENSLVQYLDLVKPGVSEQLIDAAHWADIEAIAQWLPGPITNFFGFECRLGDPIPQADFLLSVGSEEVGQRILAGQSPRYPLDAALLREPVWQQVQQFTQTWLDAASDLYPNVNNLWLEFDVNGSSAEPPIPSCFFGSQTIFVSPDTVEHATEPPHHWVSRTAIAQLQGQPMDAALEAQLLHCLDALPVGSHVFQVGLMLARQVNMVRICLRNITPKQVLNYLARLDWQGDLETLLLYLIKLSQRVERVDVDLDVSPQGISPKLGLECYLQAQPQLNPAWSQLLDYLVTEGWCLPEKRVALLKYPGFARERDHRDRWPSYPRQLSQFLGDRREGVFFRGLHHIKLVFHTDRIVEAKAYCWVSQQLIGKPTGQLAVPTAGQWPQLDAVP